MTNKANRPEQTSEMTRRLCIFDYQCPLCGRDHQASYYISTPSDNLDDYTAHLRKLLQSPHIQGMLTRASTDLHQAHGDLEPLVAKAKDHGLHHTRPPTCRLTDESDYTCDRCSATFRSMKQLRQHSRRARHPQGRTY